MLFLIVLKLDENIEVGKSVSVPTAFWNWGYIWSYSIFLYSQCIAAYRGPHHFRGNRPNFGVKNLLQSVNGNAVSATLFSDKRQGEFIRAGD